MSTPAILESPLPLPIELKCMICDLLPIKSLKHVRLVDKAWSHAAGTILWQTFNSTLKEFFERKINALLRSTTVVGLIKKLAIHTNGSVGRRVSSISETSSRTRRLLSVLPLDGLRAFTTDLDLNETTIHRVLTTQTKLLKLAVPSKTLRDNGLMANLDRLTDLTLISKDKQVLGQEHYFAFTKTLRNLALKLMYDDEWIGGEYYVWEIPNITPLLQLRSLEMHSTLIKKGQDEFGGLTDLSKLESLLLSNYPKISATIQSLTNGFLECENFALKSLIIRQTGWKNQEEPFFTELESLFDAVPALETLCITVVDRKRPSMQSICRHGNTLRYLHVDHFPNLFDYANDTAPKIKRYTPQELEQLVLYCPNIEGLSLNFIGMNLESWWPEDTFSVYDKKGDVSLADLLLPIIRLRKLRNLRITHPLFHPPDEPEVKGFPFTNQYQTRYQQVADNIMQFLAEHKSTVELLAFGPGYWPDYMFPYDSYEDVNGHYAPHYYYRRGVVTVAMGGRQTTRIVAVPWNFSRYEMMYTSAWGVRYGRGSTNFCVIHRMRSHLLLGYCIEMMNVLVIRRKHNAVE